MAIPVDAFADFDVMGHDLVAALQVRSAEDNEIGIAGKEFAERCLHLVPIPDVNETGENLSYILLFLSVVFRHSLQRDWDHQK